jgi:hypothetical protein
VDLANSADARGSGSGTDRSILQSVKKVCSDSETVKTTEFPELATERTLKEYRGSLESDEERKVTRACKEKSPL